MGLAVYFFLSSAILTGHSLFLFLFSTPVLLSTMADFDDELYNVFSADKDDDYSKTDIYAEEVKDTSPADQEKDASHEQSNSEAPNDGAYDADQYDQNNESQASPQQQQMQQMQQQMQPQQMQNMMEFMNNPQNQAMMGAWGFQNPYAMFQRFQMANPYQFQQMMQQQMRMQQQYTGMGMGGMNPQGNNGQNNHAGGMEDESHRSPSVASAANQDEG